MSPQLISIVVLIALVWVLRTDQRILRGLRRAGAITPEKAINFKTNNPLFKWRIRRLRNAQVIRDRRADRMYLDEGAWVSFRKRRRRRFAVAVALTAAAVVAWYLFAGRL